MSDGGTISLCTVQHPALAANYTSSGLYPKGDRVKVRAALVIVICALAVVVGCGRSAPDAELEAAKARAEAAEAEVARLKAGAAPPATPAATSHEVICTNCSGAGITKEICGQCHGTGIIVCEHCDGKKTFELGGSTITCPDCKGSGTQSCRRYLPGGLPVGCDGSGYIQKTCTACYGKGRIELK